MSIKDLIQIREHFFKVVDYEHAIVKQRTLSFSSASLRRSAAKRFKVAELSGSPRKDGTLCEARVSIGCSMPSLRARLRAVAIDFSLPVTGRQAERSNPTATFRVNTSLRGD
jgi:hypothetical protein